MSLGEGVYFHRQDYAGFWRRLWIDAVDLFVVACLWLPIVAVLIFVFDYNRLTLKLILAAGLILAYLYFVLLKGSRIGTLGYLLGRVRVIGIDGRPASLGALSLRAGFMFLGPFNYLLDAIWLTTDPNRQAIRDKLSATYVVRRAATPAGAGPITFRCFEICGYNLLFREIAR